MPERLSDCTDWFLICAISGTNDIIRVASLTFSPEKQPSQKDFRYEGFAKEREWGDEIVGGGQEACNNEKERSMLEGVIA